MAISAHLACISLIWVGVGTVLGKDHWISTFPVLEFTSLAFIPGAVPRTFRLHGSTFQRHLRSPVSLLFTTIYLAPCFQSNPSTLIGLFLTCWRMILPVTSDFMLGNRATTSRPRRQISWSSQYSPSPQSSHVVSIMSLQACPQLSQSYFCSIFVINVSSSSSLSSGPCHTSSSRHSWQGFNFSSL